MKYYNLRKLGASLTNNIFRVNSLLRLLASDYSQKNWDKYMFDIWHMSEDEVRRLL